MKKFNLLFITLCCSIGMMAQTDATFQFIDSNGNTVPDGSTVNITTLQEEEDPETGETWVLMPSGLSVKNTLAAPAALRINISIERIDGGLYQICFPMNCLSFSETGNSQTPASSLMASEVRNLLTEWIPQSEGICDVKLQIEVMNERGAFPNFTYTHLAYGPTITLHFNYGMPETLLGDVNGDNIVDIEDVNAAINIAIKINSISDYPGNGDMDGNGIIDIEDVNAIINLALNLQ